MLRTIAAMIASVGPVSARRLRPPASLTHLDLPGAELRARFEPATTLLGPLTAEVDRMRARFSLMAVGVKSVIVLVSMLLPSVAWAQQTASGIAGTVRDTSGAVLPGVTVEASSPVLIEKVRVVVTNAEGRYN